MQLISNKVWVPAADRCHEIVLLVCYILLVVLGPVCWPHLESSDSKPTLDHNLHLRPQKHSTILKYIVMTLLTLQSSWSQTTDNNVAKNNLG